MEPVNFRAPLILALAALLWMLPAGLIAQQTGTIQGTVTDAESLRPLAGVQLQVVGTRLGGLTNADGRFMITGVPAGEQTVRATSIGYRTVERTVSVTAGATASLDMALAASAISLDEIVVTGTAGATQRRALGNTVTTVNAEEITDVAPVATVNELLTARAPGVTLLANSGQAGTSSRVRIRGATSLSAGNEPVYYVDGVRMSAGTVSGYSVNNGVVQGTNPLDAINPDDIQSIEVIKGPAAATLYGAEAANGVIQIITKKGRAGGGVEYTAQIEAGQSEWALDMYENFTLCTVTADRDELGYNFGNRIGSNAWPGCSEFTADQPLSERIIRDQPLLRDPRALRTGDVFGTSFSARGGGDGFNFFLSGEKRDEEGVFFNNFADRTSARANVGFTPTEDLSFTLTSSYAQTHIQMPLANNASNGILRTGFRGRPGNQGTWGIGWLGFTPEISNQYDNQTWTERTILGLTTAYSPTDWFSNRLTLGLDRTDRINQVFERQDTTGRAPWGAISATGTISRFLPVEHRWTVDYNGTVSTDFTPDIASDFSAGMQFTRRHFESHEVVGEGLVADNLALVGAAAVTRADQSFSEFSSVGFYLQEQVGWRDRLFLTGAVRIDDNSAFGQDFDLVVYPKAMASYVISDEPFFNVPMIDALKLRAAFGQAGNTPPPFSADRNFEPDVTTVDGDVVNVITFDDFGNPNLKAETGSEFEAGFEASFLDGRVGADFTFYTKKTVDALVSVPDPPSTGFSGSHLVNIGEISNRGLELLLTASPVATSAVRWDATVSLATNKNELVDFGTDAIEELSFGAFATVQKHREGYPLGGFWAVDVERDAQGNPILYDADGNVTTDPLTGEVNVLSNDFEFIGPQLPTREIGFSNSVMLFDLVQLFAQLDYKGGNYQWCAMCSIRNRIDRNTWEINNPDQDPVERKVWLSRQTRKHIHPADFIKLRELAATISLPQSWSQLMRVNNAAFTLSGRNLWMWTKYEDASADPEVTFYSRSEFTALDYASTPMTRRLMASVRVTF
ncbi:MAG: SusC/RagA family TonB-linked outer membrane protein [Gemmatimonadetes bacterium]|nr:SusC/RagA family TonB-linked outer membrane protein [Gemmatimonadota bacterium]